MFAHSTLNFVLSKLRLKLSVDVKGLRRAGDYVNNAVMTSSWVMSFALMRGSDIIKSEMCSSWNLK